MPWLLDLVLGIVAAIVVIWLILIVTLIVVRPAAAWCERRCVFSRTCCG